MDKNNRTVEDAMHELTGLLVHAPEHMQQDIRAFLNGYIAALRKMQQEQEKTA